MPSSGVGWMMFLPLDISCLQPPTIKHGEDQEYKSA